MIHETACISSDAIIGNNVKVGPFTVIEGGVKIGDNCTLGPNVTVLNGTTIGSDCQLHPTCVIGGDPQDYAFKDVASYVEVGNGCILREGVTIHRGTQEDSVTTVGEGCMLMANSHVAHNCKVGNNVIMANNAAVGGYVEVGDRAFLSGAAMVHQFCKVGRLSMLGPGCILTKDFVPFCIAAPCSTGDVAAMNIVGMKRAGMDQDARKKVKDAYKLLFKAGLNVTQACEKIKQELPDGPAQEFCAFIETSTRGITTLVRS